MKREEIGRLQKREDKRAIRGGMKGNNEVPIVARLPMLSVSNSIPPFEMGSIAKIGKTSPKTTEVKP